MTGPADIAEHYLTTGEPPTGTTWADLPSHLTDSREVWNLTPHTVAVYPPHFPDKLDPATAMPEAVLEPVDRDRPARIAAEYRAAAPVLAIADGGVRGAASITTRLVSYTGRIVDLPAERPDRLYLVSLPVALAAAGRRDLLVVDREVRSPAGTVVGCRGLARVAG